MVADALRVEALDLVDFRKLPPGADQFVVDLAKLSVRFVVVHDFYACHDRKVVIRVTNVQRNEPCNSPSELVQILALDPVTVHLSHENVYAIDGAAV